MYICLDGARRIVKSARYRLAVFGFKLFSRTSLHIDVSENRLSTTTGTHSFAACGHIQ